MSELEKLGDRSGLVNMHQFYFGQLRGIAVLNKVKLFRWEQELIQAVSFIEMILLQLLKRGSLSTVLGKLVLLMCTKKLRLLKSFGPKGKKGSGPI